jgi:hypothetical protein
MLVEHRRRSNLERSRNDLFVPQLADDDHAYSWMNVANVTTRIQPVHAWHEQIRDDDVRENISDLLDESFAVAGGRHNLAVRLDDPLQDG